MSKVYNYKLKNGVEIPSIGFGTWQVPDGKPVYDAVTTALRAGYTHIDTAGAYGNEKGIGEAIRDSGIPREKLFITTKLWNSEQGYDSTLNAFDLSMERLGLEYLDLYLIHWPKTAIKQALYPTCMQETWLAFEKLYKEGRIRSIGVSNFLPHHFDAAMEKGTIFPMVNQIEIHPGYTQSEVVDYCKKNGVQVQSWSPLASGRLFENDEMLSAIAKAHGKSVAQVTLRWHLQLGLLPIPKSVTPERIVSNLDVYDFTLTDAEMSAISAMPLSGFSGFHPDNVAIFAPFGG